MKSGVPTEDSVRLAGSAAPGWTGAMVLFGTLPWLFATSMSGRRYEVELPWRRELTQRYRGRRRAGWVLVASGPVMALVGASAGVGWAGFLMWLSVLGVAAVVVTEWRLSVGVRLSPEGVLVVTRVHPDFARACRR
ncbi:hypothetical protein [Phycicoccus jejuensis]|uniref:hypothetical protein n=1 Tax=Phycicoccus jejuensis TaxID=367299 RepID=UPI0012F793CD|nr:hypothetical protein [Phycicoccus jejuensis]